MLAKRGHQVAPDTRAAASLVEREGAAVGAEVGVSVDPTDAYLRVYMEKPWYSRLYYSALATFRYGVWAAVVRAHGPRETKEKLKTYWQVMNN